MKENTILIDFIMHILNEDGTRHNADLYDDQYFECAKYERVVFYKNHYTLYKRLMQFCIDNNLIIISTEPCTLSTVVRIEEEKV